MTTTQKTFACPICATRSELHDALSAEVKAAAQVYHLVNHWRTAHEARELSNFAAEERSKETIEQFTADMEKEATWFEQYQEAIEAHRLAAERSRLARAAYHEKLTNYTNTRVAKA
jgi:hypothetical protein